MQNAALTIALDLGNPRTTKAIQIAGTADQWTRCTSPRGTRFYRVPSSSTRQLHLVSQESCTCADFANRGPQPCKHILAVRLHIALVELVS